MIPDHIRRFEILEKVGEGAFSTVYHAFDPSIKRHVALKVLKTNLIEDPDRRNYYIKMFYREARVAGNLAHPNIAVLYDIDETEDGTPFLTLEYVEGKTLETHIREGPPIPYTACLKIVHKMAAALHHAHQMGIIHRDLKPDNIRILPDYEPKILDFGFARWSEMLTTDHIIKGTPLYMAPEQIRQLEITPASDLFAFGIILWELLIGEHPFIADTVDRVLQRILEDPPGPIAPQDLAVLGVKPDHWNQFFQRVLHKTPARRPKTVLEMARGFERLMSLATNATELAYPIHLSVPSPFEQPIPLDTSDQVTEPAVPSTKTSETPAPPVTPSVRPQRPAPVATAQRPSRLFVFLPVGFFLLVGIFIGGGLAWLRSQKPPVPLSDSKIETWDAYQRLPTSKPAPTRTPTLKIESQPAGTLFWDEQEIGETPQAIPIDDDGLHKIRIEKKGYQPLNRWMLTHRQTELMVYSFKLLRPTGSTPRGTLIIHTDPPGAQLRLDRQTLDPSPVQVDRLSSGVHHLFVEREGYQPVERVLHITPGVAQIVVIRLEPVVTAKTANE